MNAAEEISPIWLDQQFWKGLNRIERHHQRLQCEHETWRRSVVRSQESMAKDLHRSWGRYCEVVMELERTLVSLKTLCIEQQRPPSGTSAHEPAFATSAY